MVPLLHQDTGVSSTRTRRQFSSAYKLQILAAANACTKVGELGALLRREGLYSSHLSVWRAAAQRGELRGPAKRRGPAPTPADPAIKRIAALERALAKVTARAVRPLRTLCVSLGVAPATYYRARRRAQQPVRPGAGVCDATR